MQEGFQITEAQQVERTGELPAIYANSVQSKVSFFDVQLVLGFIEEIRPDRSVLVKNLVTVVMSPQHAKALRDVLIQNIEAYEQAFGAIQMPPLALTSPKDATAPQQPSSRSRSAARKKA